MDFDIEQRAGAVAMSFAATEAVGGHGKSSRRFGLKFHRSRFPWRYRLFDIIAMQMKFYYFIGLPFKLDLITLGYPQGIFALNFAMADRDRVSRSILSPGAAGQIKNTDCWEGS